MTKEQTTALRNGEKVTTVEVKQVVGKLELWCELVTRRKVNH